MIHVGEIRGHRSVTLENDLLRVTVLPGKGADIYEMVDKASGVDALMKTPWGLKPPPERPPRDFLENYEGCWQELFPSVNDACEVRGAAIPFHGEVALMPWEAAIEADSGEAATVVFRVHSGKTGLDLERRMSLSPGDPSLAFEETVLNLSPEPKEFVWGHHIVLGAPFLEEGCRLEAPAATILTPDTLYEPATARLAPGQEEPWPYARGRKPDERIDLREVPGPSAHSHDDAFLGGLSEGRLAVENSRLGLRFSLDWDVGVFPWLTFWQPYGGADLAPLTGIYGMGVEPWMSRFCLAEAIVRKEARSLPPGGTFSTTLQARLTRMG
jgi:hypothetical protein